jgi:lambda family phage portal protein
MTQALARIPRELKFSWLDRFLMALAPKWGLERVRARATAQLMARHYEAAQTGGRRTENWYRTISDANAANGPALAPLRELARDLRRNNGWAKRGIQAIVNNTVGWGIMAKPAGKPTNRSRVRSEQALAMWNEWATSTACDYDGRLDFYGLQRLAMECIAESGEVLIIKQPASTQDGLPIPMRLHVVEPDYLDTNRNGIVGELGGPIIDGVEFDKFGRRVAYWLYTVHPGSQRLWTMKFQSVRTPAERVLHIYRVDRPGQIRGVSWLASAITRLKDYDDFEDAELMQQKVAACFGAFVTDIDGTAPPLGAIDANVGDNDGSQIESLEPGHIEYLPPGKTVTFGTPPRSADSKFSERTLRRIAVSLGVTYEDLTGDYSQVNFSSARMARLAHWANVHEWRWHMLIPQMCTGVWKWAMAEAAGVYNWPAMPVAKWAPNPMPILEPDKEGLAYQRLVRNGFMTWKQVISERGEDPEDQLEEIRETNAELDAAEVVLDCDPRRVNQVGQAQIAAAGGDDGEPDGDEPKPAAAASTTPTSTDDDGDDDSDTDDVEGVNPATVV